MIRNGLWAWFLVVLLWPVCSRAGDLDDALCREMSEQAYLTVPDLFYDNQPDSLLALLTTWEEICGPAEPILRLQILGSIWDGAFNEDLYGEEIIDALLWRFDPRRQEKIEGRVDPRMAPGGWASPADFSSHAAAFDTFSSNLADQLLPHERKGSLEQFFCLYYSGRTTTAWDMLRGQDLADTDLRWYYQREKSLLNREESQVVAMATMGHWRPRGELLRVGDHPQIGLLVGVRREGWLARLVGEFRPGRSDYPYFVDQDQVNGWSDRFDNFYLGLELGREVVKWRAQRLDAFLGLGLDGIKPFREQSLVLSALNANLGFGYRLFWGAEQQMVLGIDVRFEALGSRNPGPYSLSGEATTIRFGVGYSPVSRQKRRLKALDR